MNEARLGRQRKIREPQQGTRMSAKSNTLSEGRSGESREPTRPYILQPPAAGNCSGVQPEFGRAHDVERIHGIKRGKLYQKIKDGTVKSISLREPGKKFGCRLIYLPSVSAWLHGELAKQNPPVPAADVCPDNTDLS